MGWIEKKIIASLLLPIISLGCKESYTGLKARNDKLIKLFYLINELEEIIYEIQHRFINTGSCPILLSGL